MLKLPPKRYRFPTACFAVVAVLTLFVDLGDRGPHFAPAAAKTDRAGTYDLAKARNLARVIGHIRAHYVDPTRVDPKEMAIAALNAVQQSVPEVMLDVQRTGRGVPRAVEVTVDDTRKRFPLDRVGDLYELNWKLMDVFDFLERHLPPTVDLQELEYGAINGILSTLDPHSLLLPPRVYRELQLGQKGHFGGLGMVVSMEEGLLTVMSLMPGTPAAEVDVRVGDRIVQIGAESTINMTLNEAVNLMRGEAGSRVTLWLKRDGWDAARPVPITRREIQVPSVTGHSLPDGLGYVYIRNFQDNTVDGLHEALADLRARKGGLTGLVIDLRDNPGGLLDKAIGVSDLYIPHGTLVTTVREGGREREESHATHADTLTTIPLVVLVNRNSASASEIVAGALKRNDRAVILGERSFGKGSVQVVYKIDEAALKLTVAQYLTPGDVSIQGVGIVPDVEVRPIDTSPNHLALHLHDGETLGEASLDSHLSSSLTKLIKPSVRLRVIDRGEPQAHLRRQGEAFEHDALTKLAADLLKAAPAPNRKQQLVQAAGFLERRQAAESQALVKALAGQGVDWQPGPIPPRPRAAVRLKITPKSGQGGPLRAGDVARVTAEVDNTGRRPLFRVLGELRSEIGRLDGRELAFGHIPPGGTVQRTLTVRLPRSLPATGDEVTLSLYSEDKALGQRGAAIVEVDPLPRPAFAHSVRVVDPKGNRDGLIQRGEEIGLEVRITNVGEGAADKLIATVKNESGQDVFINAGREALGQLAPGASVTARFRLTVRESLKARSVQLRLRVTDRGLKTWTHDDLTVRVFPSGMPERQRRAGVVSVGAAPAPIRAGAHRDAPEIGEANPGAVLALVAAAGDWLEVSWEDGELGPQTGWVAAKRVSTGEQGGPTPEAVTRILHYQPPELALDTPALVTAEATLKLSGVARFAGHGQQRRHLYIFRGKDKVFFQSAKSAEARRDELPFEADVSLVPGANAFTVVAREGEDHITRRQFTVFRTTK